MTSFEEIRARYERAGQAQVFRFWEKLTEESRRQLLEQAAAIDLEEIAGLVATHLRGEAGGGVDPAGSELEPAPYIAVPEHGGDISDWMEATRTGVASLREGRVAAFTVAGGQGTRLGYDGPKGTFPVTPVKAKSLFQVFAEKILGAEDSYGTSIPWYLMTSEANDAATRRFFAEHDFFGLEAEQLFFFTQGMMPVVDPKGKIMLEAPDRIAMSPDGHGGSLRALYRSGALADMERRGVDWISYFQVDNPMVQAIDPAFLGFHVLRDSEMSSKMTPKAYAEEKVGVFCVRDGKTMVVEYSDLPEELMQARDEAGALQFGSGSIAIHIISRDFAMRLGSESDSSIRLPFHRAHKKVATVDDSGGPVAPSSPNGYKFEMFVFDALPFAQNPMVVECRREDEFAPVKNAEGADSPQTCREAQLRQAAAWLRAAGESVPVSELGQPSYTIEISPRFAQSEQQFVQEWKRLEKRPAIGPGLVVE